VAGAAPKTQVAPENGLHLAAMRTLDMPLAPGLLAAAEGGVLKAVARDGAAEPAIRIEAATRAAAMGVMSAGDLASMFDSIPVDVAEVAQAASRAATSPNDPMTDVLLYKSIKQMTAPEFMRDKAARIADAIGVANSFPRAYAAALLYQGDIKSLEGALIGPMEAARFAEAGMAVGDAAAAARWLGAMLGTDGLSSFTEQQKAEFRNLAELLALLDPAAATSLAERAGITVNAISLPHAVAAQTDPARFAQIVDAAFDAAMQNIPGQAGLAALAASSVTPAGDPLGDVVIGQSLQAAGLGELRRRMRFEAAWKSEFGQSSAAPAATPGAPATETTAAPAEGGLLPRIKPRSSP
ncbi:MAG: hypothetical protein RIE56_00555, partial [Amphiplicatus sp.]